MTFRQFTLRQLFLAVTVFAVGIALLIPGVRLQMQVRSNPEDALSTCMMVAGLSLIGAAIGCLGRRFKLILLLALLFPAIGWLGALFVGLTFFAN
jgi:hypothetical protein